MRTRRWHLRLHLPLSRPLQSSTEPLLSLSLPLLAMILVLWLMLLVLGWIGMISLGSR